MKKSCWVFVCVVLLTAWGFAGGVRESIPAYSEGEIAYLEGTVTVGNRTAEFGMKVKSGETVTTDAGSYCDIVFGDANVFRIHENTVAVVQFDDSSIELEKGSLSAVFTKLAGITMDGQNAFTIGTPHTVAGVRGTVFYMNVEDADSTYVCTCYGQIQYQDSEGENELYTEGYHHGALRYYVENGALKTEEGTLLYHNDKSMEDVADRISADISWGEKPYNH